MDLDRRSPIALALAEVSTDDVDTSKPRDEDVQEFETQLKRIQSALEDCDRTEQRDLAPTDGGYFLEQSVDRAVPLVVNGVDCVLTFTESYDQPVSSEVAATLSSAQETGALLPDLSTDPDKLVGLSYTLRCQVSTNTEPLASGYLDKETQDVAVFNEGSISSVEFAALVEDFTVFCDGVVADLG